MEGEATPLVISGFTVDASLLERRPVRRCNLGTCQASCCVDGVWVDMYQASDILDHAAMITPYLPAERRNPDSWFAEAHDDDPVFPSGAYIGTTTVPDPTHPAGQTCVFLRPEDRLCAIQMACTANGRAPWSLKPYYCCLFPLVDEQRGGKPVLMLDEGNSLFEHGGGCRESFNTPQPVFQVYAEETAFVLGVGGYRELCEREGITPRL